MVPEDFDYNRKLATWDERKILNGRYVSVGGKYYIVKKDGTRHLYYNGKMCDLELVSKKLAKPKVARIPKPRICEETNNGTKQKPNSPWRQFNPNYFNHDRAEWDKKNTPVWI